MMKPLVVLGAGAFARETLDIIDAINGVSATWEMLGFVVDAQYGNPGDLVNDSPILGGLDWLDSHPDVYAVGAVGAPEVRFDLVRRAARANVKFASLIHPSVIRTRWTTIGEDVVIAAGCVMSNRTTIANHVVLNPSCTIGHDVQIDSFATLGPGVLVSGYVHLHEGVYVGTGASIIEKKILGTWSIVGAGAVVIRDVPPNTTVVGVPARVIKERPDGWYRI